MVNNIVGVTDLSLDNHVITNPCPGHVDGRVGYVFRNLINTLLVSTCALSSPCFYPEDFGPFVDQKCEGSPIKFDFVIVGAGTAGCIIANRLTEIEPWSVLILEAGTDPPITSDVPRYYMSMYLSCWDWKFKTEPGQGLHYGMLNDQNIWPAGKAIGGSSVLTRMLYIRGHDLDYNIWDLLGNKGWDFSSLLHYFKKAEDMKNKEIMNCSEVNEYHGIGGYLSLEQFNSQEPLIADILEAARELTYDDIKDPDGPMNTGFFKAHGNLKEGERMNTAKCYLYPIRDRPNLFIIKDALVTKIIFENKKAIGVQYLWRNETKPRTILVKKEVILSTGTINTPKLLMMSGIGPQKQLKKFDIPIISNLQVGCNLQDHITFPGSVITLNRTKRIRNVMSLLDSTYTYLTRRLGPFSTISESEVVGFIGIHDDESPDIEIFHFFITHNDTLKFNLWASVMNFRPEVREIYLKHLHNYDLLIIHPIVLRPRSRGIIKLRSANPKDPPIIEPNYLTEQSDITTLLSGVHFCVEMAETVALRRHEAELIRLHLPACCEEVFGSDSYWTCLMSQIAGSFYDYVGTARMGPESDKWAVVDPELRVYGVTNLRVIDASIMPLIPSGNTMAGTIVIAEKGADLIKKSWLKEVNYKKFGTSDGKANAPKQSTNMSNPNEAKKPLETQEKKANFENATPNIIPEKNITLKNILKTEKPSVPASTSSGLGIQTHKGKTDKDEPNKSPTAKCAKKSNKTT